MSDEPFKPCLCGNIGITITTGGGFYRVSCDDCGYSTQNHGDFHAAFAEWNARNKDAVAKKVRRGRRPKEVQRDE